MDEARPIFNQADKLDIAQRFRADDFITLKDVNYPVRPLSGRGFLDVLELIKKSAGALTAAATESMKGDIPSDERLGLALTNIITTSAQEGEQLLKLMHFVLKRSTPSLQYDDMVEQMDFVADFERFWEMFSRQNKVDALQKKVAEMFRPLTSKLKSLAVESPSLRSVTSSAGTTDGQSTPSSDAAPTDGETTS